MFIKPETEPHDAPPMSAVTDQKELCERYSAPAPPARTTLATRALATVEPKARNAAARIIATTARPQRPTLFPRHFVSESLTKPPSGQHAAIARNGSMA